MLPAERKRKIVDTVTEEDGRSVSELADLLDVSKATIRRDLNELEEEGLIERSHGGALPVRTVASEPSYSQRNVQNLEAKRAIGARAAKEIHDGEVVFFDSGTTTIEVARSAPDDVRFITATNSPGLALELAEDDREVKLTGGTLRPQTRALVGPTGETFMQRTNFDQVFIGTNAVDVDAGLTTPNEDEARMKQLMCERAQRVVLVADAAKFGRRSFVQFAPLEDVDLVITDAALDDRFRETFESLGVDVVEEVGVAE
ncbi:HTH-type transcriptional regulator GlpR [Halosimplex aquaticum]|uniref:HTH-type transcriptional regulator GlpR n=1 Tax=Halosimplex aquaticum TaxID=3026162 RepID=A0ABD5Y289_9EURY|nr:HTH-type transcriptional regulator GlpR [Halosimplex aquaticum]